MRNVTIGKNLLNSLLDRLNLLKASYKDSINFLKEGKFDNYKKASDDRILILKELSSILSQIDSLNINGDEIKELINKVILEYQNIILLKDNHLSELNLLKKDIENKLSTIKNAKKIIEEYIKKDKENSPKIFNYNR